MNLLEAVSTCFKKYATFSGRASRSEFWWFMLFQVIVVVVAAVLGQALQGIASLVFLLPSLAVSARRLHDNGRSGWWQLISLTGIGVFVLIYWYVQPTAEGSNQHNAPALA